MESPLVRTTRTTDVPAAIGPRCAETKSERRVLPKAQPDDACQGSCHRDGSAAPWRCLWAPQLHIAAALFRPLVKKGKKPPNFWKRALFSPAPRRQQDGSDATYTFLNVVCSRRKVTRLPPNLRKHARQREIRRVDDGVIPCERGRRCARVVVVAADSTPALLRGSTGVL